MTAETREADKRAALEAENMAVVRAFFAEWSKRDADLLGRFVADDLVYQMIEDEPDIIGREAFLATLRPVLPSFQSIEMKILNMTAVGQAVLMERHDTLIGADEAHSMRFSVAGFCVVYDRKIKVLRDFPIPGGVFELGESFY